MKLDPNVITCMDAEKERRKKSIFDLTLSFNSRSGTKEEEAHDLFPDQRALLTHSKARSQSISVWS